ncbi:MAG TPA: tetratricopeptide repeat protein, partial [Methylophilaceae bacterium]
MALLKNGPSAVEALQQTIQQQPEDAIAYQMLAEALRADGQESAANEAELAAIALTQRNALLFYNLGTLYMMTQRPALAINWFRLALSIDPAS